MAPILGTLLIGLVSKFGGDLLLSAAKKIFSGSTEAMAPGSGSFHSALEIARTDRSASAEAVPWTAPSETPAPALASTDFAAVPGGAATATAASVVDAPPRAMAPPAQEVAAAYMKLDSIQTA